MNPTRKTIPLPGGGTVAIRKMKCSDFIELGEAPASMAEGRKRADATPLTDKEIAWVVASNKVILTKCTWPVCYPDGTKRRIVDKPCAETPEDELCIEEMEDDDAEAIITAVTEFTKCGKEAAAKARPFPEEQGVAAGAGPNGAALPPAAERTTGPDAG